MSSGIFNPQNRFWQTLDHFADLLILSLLWLVCSLPLVTAGAACAALYDAVARCVRGAEHLSRRSVGVPKHDEDLLLRWVRPASLVSPRTWTRPVRLERLGNRTHVSGETAPR